MFFLTLLSKIWQRATGVSIFLKPSQTSHQSPFSPAPYYLLMKAECLTIWMAHADSGALSLTIGPSRCLALCWGNRAAQQHIGGSEEASDAPGHVPRPPSPHNLACSVPTQWQTHLRWQLWWTLSSVLVTNAEIIRSDPRKRLIMMHCYCCSHPRYYIAWSPVTLTFWELRGFWLCKTRWGLFQSPLWWGLTWSFTRQTPRKKIRFMRSHIKVKDTFWNAFRMHGTFWTQCISSTVNASNRHGNPRLIYE